ncbi:hypothetical protein [Hymenobacter psychrophilus]|uniref:Uncharacterized protein n=1 Tax=Hymenobacter psychrophilus TaxID=651662 RepID=A0A1H3HSH8_9BACT|nr:hypothetical protein [Hymenobacter psychrophilus]SDY17639.1 hypothetical protein SAMN04488069_106103 [Hymenobacter psychrophilus]
MKKLLFLAPLLVAFALLGSCKKILDLLEFNVEDSQTVVVPRTLPLGSLVPLPPVSVSSSSKSTYANNGTTADYVQDVTLDNLTLTITNPASQNFNFLKRIEIYISTDANSPDQFLLASLDQVPANVSTISLTPSSQKLDLFLSRDSYTLTTKVQLNSLLTQDVTIRADERFKVKARKP